MRLFYEIKQRWTRGDSKVYDRGLSGEPKRLRSKAGHSRGHDPIFKWYSEDDDNVSLARRSTHHLRGESVPGA